MSSEKTTLLFCANRYSLLHQNFHCWSLSHSYKVGVGVDGTQEMEDEKRMKGTSRAGVTEIIWRRQKCLSFTLTLGSLSILNTELYVLAVGWYSKAKLCTIKFPFERPRAPESWTETDMSAHSTEDRIKVFYIIFCFCFPLTSISVSCTWNMARDVWSQQVDKLF
jgi:hypothetical protein